MRNPLLISLLLAATAGACNWSDFDDLEDTTWVRSTDSPDIGAGDYAVAIGGVSMGTSGGQLAVLSDDSANFSTLDYSAKGDADVGPDPIKLGEDKIGALADDPVFITDETLRQIAVVERSINGGNYAVVFGTVNAPSALEFAATANPAEAPDAAVFARGFNDVIVFAAGSRFYDLVSTGGAPASCAIKDGSGAPAQVAALAFANATVYAWLKTGELVSWGVEQFSTENPVANMCADDTLSAPSVLFTPAAGFAPGPGARIHLVGSYAILTGRATGAGAGSVFVVDTTTNTQVGTTVMVDGLRSSTVGTFDGVTYLAVGAPDRAVGDDQTVAGAVDLYALDETTGELGPTVAASLSDAHPESGQAFGRALTTMTFNGNEILVVAGDSEVFAYYKTALYDHLP
jgi:hypothetical protein